MERKTRTSYVIKNVSIGFILQVLTFVVTFGSRTVFIRLLGNDYLSVSGLFSNIITLLSFTELGIGSAVVYCLYKPIAENDYGKINALLNLFKKVYEVISFVVIILGLSIIPFLRYLVTETPDIKESIIIIYILYVMNTVVSYVYTYKKSLLIADQKNYIVSIFQQAIHIFQILLQIIFLILTQNYILYLIIQIVCTLLTNIATSIYVDIKYVNIKNSRPIDVTITEKHGIVENVKSIFMYKVGSIVLNGTDNIIISLVLKTAYVGISSNYALVINAINTILMQAINGISASIGNHTICSDKKSQEDVFTQLNIVCVMVYTFCGVCLAVLLNPLILVWLGTEYLLDIDVVLSLVLSFYVLGVNMIPSSYRVSMGLFKQVKIFPLLASLINIILSVAMGKWIGLTGVFLATSIARFTCFTLVDSRMIYNSGFEVSSKKYYFNYFIHFIVFLFTYLITEYVVSLVQYGGVVGLSVKSLVCALVSSIIILIIYSRTSALRKLARRLISLFNVHQKC